MAFLVDANVIIRFLMGTPEDQFSKSIDIFKSIEEAKIDVYIMDTVLMEVFFVLTKFYKIPKKIVIDDLKAILLLDGVINSDKALLVEVLNVIKEKNIDFVDAQICVKKRLQNFDAISFDKDILKC